MIEDIKGIAREAGFEILKFYGREFTVEAKADDSPLTQADQAAHAFICRELRELDGGTPVLSEESDESEIRERRSWRRFWLVDPLDGTKEFIKQTGEFTVNIALIENGEPILGVIHVPAREWTYFAEAGRGAWKEIRDRPKEAIRVRRAPGFGNESTSPDSSAASGTLTLEPGTLNRKPTTTNEELRTKNQEPPPLNFQPGTSNPGGARPIIVASRDHAGPQVKELLARFPDGTATSMGSSLKFCLVAEGEADVYLRDVPTMEWDVGAAQCIVEAAGGQVLTLDGQPLRYNKDDLRNPPLLTIGDPAFGEHVLAGMGD